MRRCLHALPLVLGLLPLGSCADDVNIVGTLLYEDRVLDGSGKETSRRQLPIRHALVELTSGGASWLGHTDASGQIHLTAPRSLAQSFTMEVFPSASEAPYSVTASTLWSDLSQVVPSAVGGDYQFTHVARTSDDPEADVAAGFNFLDVAIDAIDYLNKTAPTLDTAANHLEINNWAPPPPSCPDMCYQSGIVHVVNSDGCRSSFYINALCALYQAACFTTAS
jgi:hypothetical protein